METSNVFDRTIIFMKSKKDNGAKTLKRIPWDLISGDKFFVSPAPVAVSPFSESTTSTTFAEVDDLLTEQLQEQIDEISDIMFIESEQLFTSKYDNVFGFYISNPSDEFGYPRS